MILDLKGSDYNWSYQTPPSSPSSVGSRKSSLCRCLPYHFFNTLRCCFISKLLLFYNDIIKPYVVPTILGRNLDILIWLFASFESNTNDFLVFLSVRFICHQVALIAWAASPLMILDLSLKMPMYTPNLPPPCRLTSLARSVPVHLLFCFCLVRLMLISLTCL